MYSSKPGFQSKVQLTLLGLRWNSFKLEVFSVRIVVWSLIECSIGISSVSNLAMARTKIKLFQTLQVIYQKLAIQPTPLDQSARFNGKNLFFLSSLLQFLISVAAYLPLKAETVAEYGFTFAICIALLFTIVLLMIQFWKAPEIFNLIDDFQQFIETSRLNWNF